MKVQTNLKAGNALETAANQANAVAGQVTSFLGAANKQATDFTTGLVNKTTATWNCLAGAFSA